MFHSASLSCVEHRRATFETDSKTRWQVTVSSHWGPWCGKTAGSTRPNPSCSDFECKTIYLGYQLVLQKNIKYCKKLPTKAVMCVFDSTGFFKSKKRATPLALPEVLQVDHPNLSSRQCRMWVQPESHQQKHPHTSWQGGWQHTKEFVIMVWLSVCGGLRGGLVGWFHHLPI